MDGRSDLNRRQWLKALLAICANSFVFFSSGASRASALGAKPGPTARRALYFEKLKSETVRCLLCFRNCVVKSGGRGFCRNKENRGGEYYTLVHSLPCAVHVDPVEKEPAFHLLPGSEIYCLATAGCNSRCSFCQNWHISQRTVEETDNYYLPPDEVVSRVKARKIPTVSFTYSDPIAFYEYMLDIAKLAVPAGVRVLLHTNGTLNPASLRELLRYATAVTVDLKGFTDKFYREVTTLELPVVLESLKMIKASKAWLEIVNLVIPTLNDDAGDVKRMCGWIKENLGDEVPLHFTRFHPAYRLKNLPPTPIPTLEKNLEVAKEAGLKYVYIGNVPGHRANSTFCPNCGKRLIHRIHFGVLGNEIKDGKCGFCRTPIPGVWS